MGIFLPYYEFLVFISKKRNVGINNKIYWLPPIQCAIVLVHEIAETSLVLFWRQTKIPFSIRFTTHL